MSRDVFTEVVRANRAGRAVALASVCTAHPDALAASLRLAEARDKTLLIEATSNQVDQFGGYTGMRPPDFIAMVQAICAREGVDPARAVFGGDHLGPQGWRSEPAESAMAKAADLMRAYLRAGFAKIHLDCSEGCAGEPAQVGDALAASRAAALAAVCEDEAPGRALYVVGTEVPPPGGARKDEAGVAPTPPERALATLEAHRAAFAAAGASAAFERVRGLVVQPGVEFAPDHVDRLDLNAPDRLSAALKDHPDLAFEAHSTDYQYPEVYPALARRGFVVLKVGPALTFAWRQALYGLSHVQGWLDGRAHVSEVMERLMLAEPKFWRGHYPDDRVLRHFGYADRIRYYWAKPEAQAAVSALEAAFDAARPPAPLMEQYFSQEILTRAEALRGEGVTPAKSLLYAQVQAALDPYLFPEGAA
ncbi:class II D-tagatose-bisphosphate aldolase non-catalytic subunit [Neomegalonema perideroedes]|uniref:class II D-tagatose-bisphosphate aldolase non-catalytic subunit n=1 Tax=Neomegalonema perideroedes TaxID=217219 RepID=UPI000367094D|nr:class II D-tagatose-bisphosphate aldolase, non-catalytic subunit [Neomegalonema perideroedes]